MMHSIALKKYLWTKLQGKDQNFWNIPRMLEIGTSPQNNLKKRIFQK